jgi:hypothetical protein
MQILPQKRLKPAEPLVLERVNKLVKNQPSIAPTIIPDEDAVSQGQPSCAGSLPASNAARGTMKRCG